MALLFMDGFDHYGTAELLNKWSNVGGTGTALISTSNGRRGGGALYIQNAHTLVKYFPTASDTVIVGCAYYAASLTSSIITAANDFLAVRDGTLPHVRLHPFSDGSIHVTRGVSTNTPVEIGATAPGVLTVGTFNFIELKVTVSDTVGAVELRVNGVQVLALSGVDTRNGGNASINGLAIGGSVATNVTTYFDDLYVCDTTGTENNDFLGDVRIEPFFPSGPGTHNSFTKSVDAAFLDAPHTYWRGLFSDWGSTNRYIVEVEMRATPGGADQCTGGTATSSSGTAASAFDDNANTYVSFTADASWLQYQFAAPVVVKEFSVKTNTGIYTPRTVLWQASDDGVTWITVAEAGALSWLAGETKLFAAVDGSDFGLVNERVPGTGLYLTGGAAGTKETFTLSPVGELPSTDLIVAVQVNNYAKKSDAGGAAVRNLVRSGTSEATGPTVALSTSYNYVRSIHEINPATGQPWLLSEVQAMEAGLEVVS